MTGVPASALVAAVIPCLDEEAAIGPVVAAVLAQGVAEVVVVDGGSGDRTAERAAAAGARVVVEERRGYGRAIQAGIRALRPDAGIMLFLDGDGSDPPERIPDVVGPVIAGEADFVLGSRLRGAREPGSLSPQQVTAGRIAGALLRARYGVRFTDTGVVRPVAETAGCADQAAKGRSVGRPGARLRCSARIWSGVRYPCRATSQVAL